MSIWITDESEQHTLDTAGAVEQSADIAVDGAVAHELAVCNVRVM